MSEYYVLDKDGNPVATKSIMEWGKDYDAKERHVGNDMIGDIHVSTVFLGIDHRHSKNGFPILWETMIFGGDHDNYQVRYTSHDDAVKGHAEAVALVRGESK